MDTCIAPAFYANYKEYFNAGGIVRDNCGSVTLEYRGDVPDASDPTAIIRTYRFYDECGLWVEDNQKINLKVYPTTFDPLGPYCQNTTTSDVLPLISTEGITGSWSPATIQTNVAGVTTYTFTPDPGQCALATTMDILINPAVQLSENLSNHVDVGFNINPIGNIEIEVLQGTPDFEYEWTGPNSFVAFTRILPIFLPEITRLLLPMLTVVTIV